MISVRVNEILKYLSSDKKERLKRCVQMESLQKLDNSRTHRNNVANALSSSSSSSSSMSVGVDAGPEEQLLLGSTGSYQMPPTTSSGLTVDGADDEELKAREKFHNNSGDNELHTAYKKRRPLTVLKSQNVQCLMSSYTSSPTPHEISFSLAPDSLFIPTDHVSLSSSSHDVKQLNGYKTKSDTKSKNRVGVVSRGLLQMDVNDSVKQETTKESRKGTSDGAGIAPKGKSKQIENRKHSKRKTGSSSSTAEAEAPVAMAVTKEPPCMENKSLSEAESIDCHHPSSLPSLGSGASSPSCVSSRKSKKQNRQKEGAACSKIPEHIVNYPSHELNEHSDVVASPHLGNNNAKSKTSSSKLQHSAEREDHSKGQTTTTSTKEKDKKLDRSKNNCGGVWPSGYTSTSGVAELDTFEITSSILRRNQKQLATKRVAADKRIADHINVSSSNEVNALDTFDEPVVRPVTRRSFDASPSVQQKHRSSDAVSEKWIQVNRKVKRVIVPSNVVGHILGSNGSKLEAICQVTRAHIELERTTNPSETIFVLRGSLEQMQAASNMISALMKDSKSSTSDIIAKTGNVAQAKNGCSPMHLPPPPLVAKDLKLGSKPGQSPVPLSITNNAIMEKCAGPPPPPPQGILQVNSVGQNDDEDYAESILSSASEERSDPCSERCSPAQDLLVGEYSLFEHGLGQPLEKLLARKDSSRQTFARAAAVRTPSRTLAPIIPNRSTIDQLLLAKAPGYRNAKAMYDARDAACFAKTADLGIHHHVPIGRFGWQSTAISGRGLERAKENDPYHCTTSQLFSIDSSSNAHIPLLERPLSAPGFPSARSSSSSAALPLPPSHDRCSAASAPDHRLLTVHTFSNLNPNAPDFVFTLPLEEPSSSANRLSTLSLKPCGSRLLHSPFDPSADGSGCLSTDASAGEFSYSMSPLGGTFESTSVEMSDSSACGGGGQDGGFTLPRSAADDGMCEPPLGGDNLNAPWLCSPEPWLPSKMSYSGMGRGEQGGTSAAIASYPSRGDLYRNYFAHPSFSPSSSSSPYNCAFYQQQNMMLAPVQSWNHATQTVAAQAGP